MMIGKHIRAGFKTLGARFFKKRYPIKINFISTYRCNNNCSYCNISKLKKKKELSTGQIKDMISSLKKVGAEHITFIGGEPLLRDDIGELVSFAKKQGLLTTMSSNCNLYEKKSSQLKDLDLLICCLNGPEKIHDSIRGKGNYQKIIKALSSKKAKLATMILTKQNYKHIDFLLEKAKQLNFNANFQPVFRNELAKVENQSLKGIILSKEEVQKAFKYLLKKKKQGAPILNSYQSLKNFAKYGKARFKNCYHGQLSITIDPYGNVYRCYKYSNTKDKINGLSLGWKKAFYSIKLDKCIDCDYNCHIEDNLLFMLSISSITNLLKLNKLFKNGK